MRSSVHEKLYCEDAMKCVQPVMKNAEITVGRGGGGRGRVNETQTHTYTHARSYPPNLSACASWTFWHLWKKGKIPPKTDADGGDGRGVGLCGARRLLQLRLRLVCRLFSPFFIQFRAPWNDGRAPQQLTPVHELCLKHWGFNKAAESASLPRTNLMLREAAARRSIVVWMFEVPACSTDTAMWISTKLGVLFFLIFQ